MDEYINFNGEVFEKDEFSLKLSNRAFRFGDSIFETIRVFDGKIIFIDHHFSRLINSLNIVKISIPKYFTKDFFSSEIIKLIKCHKNNNARIRFTIYRKSSSSIYFVDANDEFDYVIEYSEMPENSFGNGLDDYEVDIFEDIKKDTGVLSQIKSNNVLLHSIAGSVAREKSINNIILINQNYCLTEAVNANVFIVKNQEIITPRLSDGCVDGIIRKILINLIRLDKNYIIIERSISKEELLTCDEVFITNSIIGIQSIDKYRSTKYSRRITSNLKNLMNSNVNSLLDRQEN